MKTVTKFLSTVFMTMLMTLVGVSAWGRVIPMDVIEDVYGLKGGDTIFIQGRWNTTEADMTSRWVSVYYPSEETDSVAAVNAATIGDRAAIVLEDAGVTFSYTNTLGETHELKGFYLKSLMTGDYLSKTSAESGENYASAIGFTKEKSTVWYFDKAIKVATDEATESKYDASPANAFYVMTLAGDKTPLFLNNNYNNGTGYYFRVATFDNSTVWHEIDSAYDDTSLEGAISDLDDLYTVCASLSTAEGTNPGFCDHDYLIALQDAEADAQDDSKLGTVEDVKAVYNKLLKAYLDFTYRGLVPVTDGYYYFVNSDAEYSPLQENGTQIALLTKNKNEIWWASLDSLNAAYIWKIKSAGNGYYTMQNLGTQEFVENGAQNVGVFTTTDTATIRLKDLGAGQWAVYVARNTTSSEEDMHYIHAYGHGASAATGHITCLYRPLANDHSGWYMYKVPKAIGDSLAPKDDEIKKAAYAAQLADSLKAIVSKVRPDIMNAMEYDYTDSVNVSPTLVEEQANGFADCFSNAGMSVESGYNWGSDGDGYTGILDYDQSTYFHTTYNSQPSWSDYSMDGKGFGYKTTKHTLGYKLRESVDNVTFVWQERNGWNDAPVNFDIEASTDGTTWTPILYNYDLYTHDVADGVYVTAGPFKLNGSYNYVRILTDGCSRGHFFNFGSFHMYKDIKYSSTCPAVKVGEAVFGGLVNAYLAGAKTAQNDSVSNIPNLEAAITNLTKAYATYESTVVDPTALKEKLTEGNTILDTFLSSDTYIGAYDSSADTTALHAAVSDGETLLSTGVYTEDDLASKTTAIETAINDLATHIVKPDPNKVYRITTAAVDELLDYIDVARFDTATYKQIERREVYIVKGYEDNALSFFSTPDEVNTGNSHFYSAGWDETLAAPELGYFRFINVGDSAYAVQSISTGLYIPDLVQSANAVPSLRPGLFTFQPLGYGMVYMLSHNMNTGKNNNQTLHFGNQKYSQYQIVGYPDKTLGSKSCLRVEEVSDVEMPEIAQAQITGTQYTVFNEDLTGIDGAEIYVPTGKSIDSEGNTYIIYSTTDKVEAGKPVFIVPDDPEIPYMATLGTTFTKTATAAGPVVGTFLGQELPQGDAILRTAADNTYNWLIPSVSGTQVGTYSVFLNTADILSLPDASIDDAALTMLVSGLDGNALVGISKVKDGAKATKAIYTIDGVKLNTDVDHLKKGIYIIGKQKKVIK